eukprot:Cvel_16597.t1-p1 / transcript=Cvel_16597.t1 / gene=Cvel_16597 / organism=Chromera_velia_CCMP2878 / gene_product=Ubiquitin carboxyl-terminal hydrolase 64E, putative / transcript_product=Ubiquitin carboxyl-terminal hydrolase 64E, putative / location=Cvel_scaffold1285:43770-50029(+) / protein_length=570 / sequence_SO=supercontig / SO=protein_coding / is_pseudo=false
MDRKRQEGAFAGLSNQGATCYMNSLLQTLYMTPEFRKGLYAWTYDKESDGEEEMCIPLQLQKLFGLLQISDRSYAETKDLTKSFGWNTGEAFQQHDVQEFCRVLFDAIEALHGGDEENFISEAFTGHLLDYVMCKECKHMSSRRDKFMDLALTINNPFENIQADSLETAMEGFLKTEVLDGANQYECSACNKKVDALKGLRLSTVPPILTLQLKRFDLDYMTFQRRKINDRVSFPTALNLNPFLKDHTDDIGASPAQGPAADPTHADPQGSREGKAGEGEVTEISLEMLDGGAAADGAVKEKEKGPPGGDTGDEGLRSTAAPTEAGGGETSTGTGGAMTHATGDEGGPFHGMEVVGASILPPSGTEMDSELAQRFHQGLLQTGMLQQRGGDEQSDRASIGAGSGGGRSVNSMDCAHGGDVDMGVVGSMSDPAQHTAGVGGVSGGALDLAGLHVGDLVLRQGGEAWSIPTDNAAGGAAGDLAFPARNNLSAGGGGTGHFHSSGAKSVQGEPAGGVGAGAAEGWGGGGNVAVTSPAEGEKDLTDEDLFLEDAKKALKDGEHVYELYSVMVHS